MQANDDDGDPGGHAGDDQDGSEVQRQNLSRDRFIAVLAHELRNPLAPIRSGLDLLASERLEDPEQRRETVGLMQRQFTHLVRLMDDLLDTARLSSGALPVVHLEPVRLRQVLNAALESIAPALHSKQQHLQLDQPEIDIVVLADPVRLAQAFTNILDSSVKVTAPRGTVSVTVELLDEQVKVSFEDEGPGLSSQEAENLFVLFPRDAVPQDSAGLSIGLALVKGLVELNGGTVQVTQRGDLNDTSRGTIFTVNLPVSGAQPAGSPQAGGGSPAEWRGRRVLVVDDNRDAATLLGMLFELDGETVRLAHDGPSAVEEAREFQPEVILMDIGLPGFDGLEAIRRVRGLASQVRPYIVALTGWGADADREASRLAGVDLHLVKPVTHEALQTHLRSQVR